MEGTWIGDTGEVSTLNKVMFWEQIDKTETWGVVRVVQVGFTFFEGILDMLWFNYSFLDNWAGWTLRVVLLGPIVAGIIWGLVMSFIGAIRGILGS